MASEDLLCGYLKVGSMGNLALPNIGSEIEVRVQRVGWLDWKIDSSVAVVVERDIDNS